MGQYNQCLSLCLLCDLLLLIEVDVEAKSNAPVEFASSGSLAQPSASAAFPSCCCATEPRVKPATPWSYPNNISLTPLPPQTRSSATIIWTHAVLLSISRLQYCGFSPQKLNMLLQLDVLSGPFSWPVNTDREGNENKDPRGWLTPA